MKKTIGKKGEWVVADTLKIHIAALKAWDERCLSFEDAHTVNAFFRCWRLGCFIFIQEGCPSSAVASEGSHALKILCWTNSVIHYFYPNLWMDAVFVQASLPGQRKDGRSHSLRQQHDGG